ncbi:hypothetical protein NQZ79_g4421 [Umbelopsis isabellina]|nr:hypothetical protein NQZ79_g4421 [Umbelopsis isabellina]
MRKFLGLAKPYHSQDEDSDPENRHFSWSWRPSRPRRKRRTKSCAARHPTPGPSDLPGTTESSPDRFSSLESSPGSPITHRSSTPIYHRSRDDTPKLLAPHPLSACPPQILERDWKARTWPYEVYDADDNEGDDEFKDAQDETGYEYPGRLTPTPTPTPLDQQPYFSSVSKHLTYSSPPRKDREYPSQADITSKNRSGNTTDKMVSYPLNHSNPEHGRSSHSISSTTPKMMSISTSGSSSPISDQELSDSESYHQGDFVHPTPHQIIHLWPRDTSDDPSYPAAVNCASSFKFRPPGRPWKPSRRYQQPKSTATMPSTAAATKLEEESMLLLRAKLEKAEATVASLRQQLDQMKTRHLPSPANSDDEGGQFVRRRSHQQRSHHKHSLRYSTFSEERITTGR